ncbi:MAG TPA: GNAT family N-acetyltransferase [Pyrinomonadaceae bacterium]
MVKVAEKFFIRPASTDEAELLSDLALRSKAHWGYSQEFLEVCRRELTLTPDYISTSPVFVLEEEKRVVGFYGLRARGDEVELLYLFIEPSAMNHGYGRQLWNHAVETAVRLGFQRISIESDPYAEAFYQAMGALTIKFVSSSVKAERKLPILEFPLNQSLS